jgi:hypothetical protein
MNTLNIEKTFETAGVFADPTAALVRVEGSSFPENAFIYFAPLVDWIEQYFAQGATELSAEFRMTYFNTASSKALRNLVKLLDGFYAAEKRVRVTWYYDPDDEDMQDVGKSYSLAFDVPISVQPLDE